MSAIEKVKSVVLELLEKEVNLGPETRLSEDLMLDSANLIELTVLIHTKYGVDIGRKSVERKVTPETLSDLASLMGE